MPSHDQRLAGALFGSLAGDALTLGAHWIYNPSKIARLFGRTENLTDPTENPYHQARQTGDFTHYGDQTLVLMRSLEPGSPFELDRFAQNWSQLWSSSYPGYIDGATKDTRAYLDAGKAPADAGSSSNDLAGASRIAPLVVALHDQPRDTVTEAARRQTAFTHADPGVVEAAAFFAGVTWDLFRGTPLPDALDRASSESWQHLEPGAALEAARADATQNTVQALQSRGLTCHLPDAFPSVLYLLAKYPGSLEEALIENTMAGGDSAARGLLVGLVLGAAHGIEAVPGRWRNGLRAAEEMRNWLEAHACRCDFELKPGTNRFEFQNAQGTTLAGRLEWPPEHPEKPRAVALFAHCFTCSKDLPATARISRALAAQGIAVLRFDFTGLGSSDGDFANTDFSSNVDDLLAAARHLVETAGAPTLLIGHSLGGAAVLAAGPRIPSVRGIVTIGAPSDPAHVAHLFDGHREEIETTGEAEVSLAGRAFRIRRQFLQDIAQQRILDALDDYRGALLVMHAPRDEVVGIEHAGEIYSAAKHPKSFISLAEADHLLTRSSDTEFAARLIAAWSTQFTA